MNKKKSNMERKVYVTTKFIESMVLPQLSRYKTDSETVSLDELRKEKHLFSSIKNGALNNTLSQNGVRWEQIDMFKADRGDVIYSIRVEGLKLKLHEYSNLPELPRSCTLVIKRHRVL